MDNSKVSDNIKAFADIVADKNYVHDPEHKNKPHDGREWHRTERGWSTYKPHKKTPEKPSEKPSVELPDNHADKANLANSPETDASILMELSKDKDPDIRCRVASNRNTPEETLKKLANDKDGHVSKFAKETLEKRKSGTEAMTPEQKALHSYSKSDEAGDRASVASNPKTHPSTLAGMKNDISPLVRKNLAANPSTPVDILSELAKDEITSVRGTVATRKDASKETLERLSKDSNGWVAEIAKDTLGRLDLGEWKDKVESKDVEVRRKTAQDRTAPAAVLERLAKDTDGNVKCYVAINPNTPPETLAELSHDKNFGVRSYVAWNSNTPAHIAADLAGDEDYSVRSMVAKRLQALPENIQMKLANDEHPSVRGQLACNPYASQSALRKLTQDKVESVRNDAAKMLSFQRSLGKTAEKLAKEGDVLAKRYLAKRAKERHDFCAGEIGDEETYGQMKEYKKAIGEKKGWGRSPEQVKQDFIKNMNPAKYDSPEAFRKAKERIQNMPTDKFDKLLGVIFNKAEEEEEEE